MSRMLGLFTFAALSGTLFIAAGPANATHSWNGYHWSRASNPFTVTLGDNLSANWTPYLATAASDWSITSGACNNPQNPIRCTVAAGGSHGKRCRPTAGRVEVCNGSYGNNGWLGIAQIWISGVHITQGTVRVNDTYFDTPQYNTPAWHSFVMDQEVGHEFGLAHQDEDFNNADLLDACGRGSCMDYSADPSNNTMPNQHDYDELVIIYSHSDGAAAVASAPVSSGQDLDEDMGGPNAWGNPVHFENGRADVYERDLGSGNKVLTRVIWAQ
ncbi:MAG: hypothetical protein E6K76_11625 [Candidatus Eisenbacteria bacterium]|uniref:Matrixin family metalloprotease n=1 Tax=Eiseniibacteriota bacterium TaxID=2212470 RepID=A0A538T0N1_UNCEI|nr:MAG: hypothetical protein E6K76_11625 [Candidatus Eisenbacteria bacterium]